MAYGRYQKVPPRRVDIPNNIDMKILKKAVWLSNNIFQSEKKSYIEIIVCNSEGDVMYYCPTSSENILEMDARFAKACMIVYTAIEMRRNITAAEMEELNSIYKMLKKEYGS